MPHNFFAPVEHFRYFHLFAICVLPCGGSYQFLRPTPLEATPLPVAVKFSKLQSARWSGASGSGTGHGRHKYMACLWGEVGGRRQTRIQDPGYWMAGYWRLSNKWQKRRVLSSHLQMARNGLGMWQDYYSSCARQRPRSTPFCICVCGKRRTGLEETTPTRITQPQRIKFKLGDSWVNSCQAAVARIPRIWPR